MTTQTLGGWLVHVMRQADGALSLEEALHVIMDSMKTYFPSQSVAVILIDEDTKELRIKTSRQLSYTFVKKYHRDGPSPTAESVVLEQNPILLNNLSHESEAYGELKLEHAFDSAVLAPVVRNQRGIGYIFCDRTGDDCFTDSDLLHLQVVGYLIGQMIEKFDLVRQGKKLSQIDDATQVLQYKAFIPNLSTELERAKAHDYPVALALLSVGAFRHYIETFGIDAAHALLAEVAQIVKDDLRETDFIGRFGADEFILCLSGLDADAARHMLESLSESITERAIGAGDTTIEVAIGALLLKERGQLRRPLQDILGALGKCLVKAKSEGGDTVILESAHFNDE